MNANSPLKMDPAAAGSPGTLDSIPEGLPARIDSVDTQDPLVVRLMTLGLVEGAEITRTGGALGGDPLEFALFGVRISLRRQQARCFWVSPITDT